MNQIMDVDVVPTELLQQSGRGVFPYLFWFWGRCEGVLCHFLVEGPWKSVFQTQKEFAHKNDSLVASLW